MQRTGQPELAEGQAVVAPGHAKPNRFLNTHSEWSTRGAAKQSGPNIQIKTFGGLDSI